VRVGGHRDTQRTPRGSIAQWKLNVTDQGSDRSCICVLMYMYSMIYVR
jgi:hypothetical protein